MNKYYLEVINVRVSFRLSEFFSPTLRTRIYIKHVKSETFRISKMFYIYIYYLRRPFFIRKKILKSKNERSREDKLHSNIDSLAFSTLNNVQVLSSRISELQLQP